MPHFPASRHANAVPVAAAVVEDLSGLPSSRGGCVCSGALSSRHLAFSPLPVPQTHRAPSRVDGSGPGVPVMPSCLSLPEALGLQMLHCSLPKFTAGVPSSDSHPQAPIYLRKLRQGRSRYVQGHVGTCSFCQYQGHPWMPKPFGLRWSLNFPPRMKFLVIIFHC